MAVIQSDGCPLYVETTGPERAPVIMLSNSLGTTHEMWEPQLKQFARDHRVVRYDRRGHGRSGVAKGPYTMEMLGRDALAIMDALDLKKVNWCGLSMGGMVGQWLGANAPERIERLVLANTHYYYPGKDFWNDRIRTVSEKGLAAIVGPNMERWFTKDFRENSPGAVARMSNLFLATPVEGYLACCAAVRDMDHRDLLGKITAPTLVIAGRHDQATPVDAAEYIRSHIPGAAMTLLDAAHISNIEQADDFTAEVLGFFNQPRR
jgi:3-oxoadipate enol-lactonase